MDPAEYEKMYSLEDTYWWFQGRRAIVEALLNRLPEFTKEKLRILDLGCGTGLMLEHLTRRHWTLGLDFSPLALRFSRMRGVTNLARADAAALPLADSCFDLVTALDIAEHVENDDRLLSEAARVLKHGGRLVVSVPAHPFLWSEHDDALYHQRRYTRRSFERKLCAADFEIERLTYCITFTFPMIVAFRVLQRLLKPPGKPKTHVIELPRWANRLLLASVKLEGSVLKFCNLPFGVTLLAVVRKRH